MATPPPRRRASRPDPRGSDGWSLDRAALRRRVAGRASALGDGLDPRGWPRWLVGVLLLAVPSHALGAWRVLAGVPPGMRPPTLDSIIFEYVGWYLTVGARLYVDVWELKPPLPFELTALLAVLAGGDPVVLHRLGVGVSILAAVGTAVVAGALVRDLTGDEVAAFAAGAALYVYPAFHWRAAYGFKVKYLVPLFVLAALYGARRDRHVAGGVLAGAAAASWQLAVVAPVLVAAESWRRAGPEGARRTALGAVGVVALSLAPVVAWSAVEAMVAETLLVPLLVTEEGSVLEQVRLVRVLLGGSIPVASLGLVGVVVAAARRPRATWWLPVGVAWFGLMALLVDLDGPPDLFPVLAFLAVGVGLLLGLVGGDQRPAAVLVALTAVLAVTTAGGFGLAGSPLNQPGPVEYQPDREVAPPYDPVERAHLFWTPARPETCRVFLGRTQYREIQLTGAPVAPATCGELGPLLEALRERYLA